MNEGNLFKISGVVASVAVRSKRAQSSAQLLGAVQWTSCSSELVKVEKLPRFRGTLPLWCWFLLMLPSSCDQLIFFELLGLRRDEVTTGLQQAAVEFWGVLWAGAQLG